MARPLLICLVNAGCRQAGPEILFDLFARVSGCCKHLRHGRLAQGRNRHPAARLEVPSECAATTGRRAVGVSSRATRSLRHPPHYTFKSVEFITGK